MSMHSWESAFADGSFVAVGKAGDTVTRRRVIQLVFQKEIRGVWVTVVYWEGDEMLDGSVNIDTESNFRPITESEAPAVRQRWPTEDHVLYRKGNFPQAASVVS